MNFKTKYKIVLLKRYFDVGYAATSYMKYLIAFIGGAEIILNQSYTFALSIGFLYGIGCFIFGWLWIKQGWLTAEIEVSNQYNKFVHEMRDGLKNGKV